MSKKTSKKQLNLEWRGSKVLELSSQGYVRMEIASSLQVSQATVSSDLIYLKDQVRQHLEQHIQESLRHEYQKCMHGINNFLKIAWSIATKQFADDKTKLQALQLINDCNKYKMDLATNGVVITDAIKYVQTSKEKLTMSTKEDNNDKESKEPDYDEDEEQLEEKQEEETGELREEKITNQVF